MAHRTDLAVENENYQNYDTETKQKGNISITKMTEKKEKGQKFLTISFPDIMNIVSTEELEEEIINSLQFLTGKAYENILVTGLGNTEITADSIGPETASMLLATRHIKGEFAESIGLFGLKSVSIIATDVLGKTGIETAEIIRAVADKIKPDLIIAIDALAAGSTTRLFRTIQLTNSGISPGSGVKNSRKEISQKTMGIPVVAIGVPTVVDVGVIAEESGAKKSQNTADMILTPKDSDILCKKISEILSRSLNVFLQPNIEKEVIMSLV